MRSTSKRHSVWWPAVTLCAITLAAGACGSDGGTAPDEEEAANGVATLTRTAEGVTVKLVTQLGALSVANPEGGALPEEVEVQTYFGDTWATFLKPSSLVPIGATVMTRFGFSAGKLSY